MAKHPLSNHSFWQDAVKMDDEDDFYSPNPEISGTIRYINKHFYVKAGCQEQIFDNINELLNWIGAELTKQIKIHEAAEKELKEEREKSGWEDPFAANRREEEGGE